MASFNVQFHATADELGDLAETVLSKPSIDAVVVRYHPFAVARLGRGDVREALGDPTVRRIVFTRGEATLVGTGNLELLDANQGALVLDIGRQETAGLLESRLSAATGRAEWKEALGELNRQTVAGVVGVHEKTGASAEYRAHRLSHGAVALAARGTVLRPFATSPVVLRPLARAA